MARKSTERKNTLTFGPSGTMGTGEKQWERNIAVINSLFHLFNNVASVTM